MYELNGKKSDEELVTLAQSGDKHATEELLIRHAGLVRGCARGFFLIGGETEDLIQEGMIGLFKAVRDFNPEKEANFFSFAELCINRQLYSALEASNRKKHIPLNTYISFSSQSDGDGVDLEDVIADQNRSPEQLLIEQEGKEEFHRRLEEKLSPMEKKVLYLYLEGNSYTQIGLQMDKTPKSIDNTLQRIRGKIKDLKNEV